MALIGTKTLANVTAARLPSSSLASLAGLRRVDGIAVLDRGEHSWVFWPLGETRVLDAVLPAPGVELFERRGDEWFRPGRLLPCFGVPTTGESIPIDRAVTPGAFEAEPPPEVPSSPLPLALRRDPTFRPTSATLCPLVELANWAEWATTAEIEAIRGAIRGDLALLLGKALPTWPGSVRYWGRRVLIPIGFAPAPDLPEEVLLETLGASGDEVFRLISAEGGVEAESIPIVSFGDLSRAGIRLVRGGARR